MATKNIGYALDVPIISGRNYTLLELFQTSTQNKKAKREKLIGERTEIVVKQTSLIQSRIRDYGGYREARKVGYIGLGIAGALVVVGFFTSQILWYLSTVMVLLISLVIGFVIYQHVRRMRWYKKRLEKLAAANKVKNAKISQLSFEIRDEEKMSAQTDPRISIIYYGY
ncbi:MAG: hypothetical protein FWC79_04390 [Oscillospiraceae bacterium]|nr:hypothetical protein [Oscillospiraceae bacterium]